MDRRQMLAGAAALAIAGPAAAKAPDEAAFDAAFNYAYPLFEFARASKRSVMTGAAGATHAERLNKLGHRRGLSDATARAVTSPNNDTVYSSAFLELSGGPVEITAATLKDRYWSIAFMNAFTDNFAYIGSRATRGEGGKFWIVGPDFRGRAPAGVTLIRSDTNDVWMLVRILVTGPEDLPAANAAQDGITLTLPEGRGPARGIASATDNGADGPQVLAAASEMLSRQRAQRGQAARARRFARLGLRAGAGDFAQLPQEIQDGWRAAGPRGIARLKAAFANRSHATNGWSSSSPTTGDFGNNDMERATVALGGIAALGQKEAMYFQNVSDAAGAPLDSAHTYRLRIPKEGVPVDAFWSVTMYQAEPDGRFFFVDNPINRYAIGDRTPGLQRNADGSIDIILSRAQPAAGNWLPMPNGPLRVSFRAYVPRAEMLEGRWYPPAPEKIG